jgi:hypothetical protein
VAVANPADPVAVYQNVTEWRPTPVGAGVTAGTYLIQVNNNVALAGASSGATALYLDPADYTISGKTLRCRLQCLVLTNSVAPAVNFTFHLYPVATTAGTGPANPTIATVGTSVTNAVVTAPGATSTTPAVSSDVNFPAAGLYVFAFIPSGTTAANSAEYLGVRLQARQV